MKIFLLYILHKICSLTPLSVLVYNVPKRYYAAMFKIKKLLGYLLISSLKCVKIQDDYPVTY